MGRNPILEETGGNSEVGYGSATEATFEQRGDPGDRTRSAVLRGECFDHYTSLASIIMPHIAHNCLVLCTDETYLGEWEMS